jgi:hypothetical protein
MLKVNSHLRKKLVHVKYVYMHACRLTSEFSTTVFVSLTTRQVPPLSVKLSLTIP